MKKWLCLFICCLLLLPVIAACGSNNEPAATNPTPDPAPQTPAPTPAPPKTVYVLNFADGKSDFLAMNTGTPGTDIDSEMALVDLDGAKALKLIAPNGNALRLGINISGLLGDRVEDVRNIVFEVYADYPGGNFSAVSGSIAALSGESTIANSSWQIYLASRNPVSAIMELGPNVIFTKEEANIIEFSCTTNGPADRGEAPANIFIKSVTFFDSNNEAIEINTGAQFASPEGWGDKVILGGWILPNPPHDGNPGGWQTWLSPGVDGTDYDDMPWEVVAASFGIVIEMEEPDSFEFVYFGAFNGWSWTQVQLAEYWSDGALRVLWSDIGFDPTLVTETDNAVKLAIGNWNEVPISLIYLLYDEDAVDLG